MGILFKNGITATFNTGRSAAGVSSCPASVSLDVPAGASVAAVVESTGFGAHPAKVPVSIAAAANILIHFFFIQYNLPCIVFMSIHNTHYLFHLLGLSY